MYPEDLSGPRQRLSLFLIQYWGGPSDYDQLRGHPRLRLRHRDFPIGHAERKAWLEHMSAAVRAGGLAGEDEEELISYFTWASATLVNRPARTPPGGRSLPVVSGPASSDE
jgi:hemoglobin